MRLAQFLNLLLEIGDSILLFANNFTKFVGILPQLTEFVFFVLLSQIGFNQLQTLCHIWIRVFELFNIIFYLLDLGPQCDNNLVYLMAYKALLRLVDLIKSHLQVIDQLQPLLDARLVIHQ